jgi:hypothetical protein
MKRRSAWITGFLLVLGVISAARGQSDEDLLARIDAQTSTSYPTTYRELRIAAAFHHEWASGFSPSDRDETEISLLPCALDVSRELTWPEQVALEITYMEGVLTANQIELEAWSSALRAYETLLLTRLKPPQSDDDPASNQFYEQRDRAAASVMRMINERRTPSEGFKRPVSIDLRCGGAEGVADTFVQADPPEGRIWLMDAFDMALCRRRVGEAAWNVRSCRWREVHRGASSALSGRYYYQARWSDGSTRVGDVVAGEGITPDRVTSDGEHVIVIRR